MRIKILVIIMSVISISIDAQIINYSTSDGLIDNFIECIAVDVNDNIWFGSSVGVQMYDGVNWIAYDQANFPGMLSDNIKCINTMANGDIWIGTDFGANQLVAGVSGLMFLSYTNTNGLISNQVKSIDEDANGGVWIGTNQGVSYFDGSSWISYTSPDLHWSGVNATAFDSNGDKWFASPLGGITHFDGINFTSYDTANGLLSQYVTDLVIDNQDNKWVGTSSGMSVLDASNTTFTHHTRMYLLPPPDTLNPVVNIDIDSWGRVWTSIYVGYLAEGGVAYWNGNQWEDYDVTDGLAGPNVKELEIDSQNNIWIATTTGVSRISSVPSALVEVEDIHLQLFPNPCSDILYLISDKKNIESVYIYDNIGSLVYINKDNYSDYKINTSSFCAGIYHMNIHLPNTILNKKIVVH